MPTSKQNRLEQMIESHRSLYLQALDVGHEMEALWHEDQVDALLDQWNHLAESQAS